MQITVLKSKIHKVEITNTQLHYDGSCAIDEDILKQAGIESHEQIHIYNITNGERFITYAIPALAGSGIVSLNGAAARLGMTGDIVIICAYGEIDQSEIEEHKPKNVYWRR